MGFLRKIFRNYILLPLLFSLLRNKLPKVKALDALETVQYLLDHHCSCVRFGDGELAILTNTGNPAFQKSTKLLRDRMEQVLTSRLENLLVCVTGPATYRTLDIYSNRAKNHFRNVIVRFNVYLTKKLIPGETYGEAQFTRPYLDTLNRKYSEEIFENVKKLFDKKHIILVEGSKTRFGVGNDLLKNASKVTRILAPSMNAFDQYDEILKQASNFGQQIRDQGEDVLFLLALGPAAKLLTYDLTITGFRAIDIGHLDIEYEWYLRGTTEKISIPGKYVNEAKNGSSWDEDSNLNLSQYNKEVVVRIGD